MMVAPSERFEQERSAVEFDRLVSELEGRLDHLAEEGLEAIRGRAPSRLCEEGPIWDQLSDCVRGALRTEWAAFRDGILPGRLPDVDGALIVMASRLGDLDTLLAGYRFAQIALWGSWFELIEASEAAEPVKRELLRDGSRYFFQYADLVSRYIAEGYQRGVEPEVSESGGHRTPALRTLLDADPLADARLEIELNRFHLGLIAWGEGADDEARSLAFELDRQLLLLERLEHGWWGWLSGSRPLRPRQWQQLHRFDPRRGVRFAFGLEGYGEAGFRTTHHQALRARSVSRSDPAVTHYDDVAIEALATETEGDARLFVAHELRGIDDDSAASQRLRETLTAYFDAELNAASAAAALGVHHQTVANRLRAIEERLGHPPAGRHLQLAVALRLREAMIRGRD